MGIHVGAEFSFRQREFNRLFCKPIIHVRIFLIAKTALNNMVASVKGLFAPQQFAAVSLVA